MEERIIADLRLTPEIQDFESESSSRNSYLSFEETRKFAKDGSQSIGLTDRLASLREKERALKLRLQKSDFKLRI